MLQAYGSSGDRGPTNWRELDPCLPWRQLDRRTGGVVVRRHRFRGGLGPRSLDEGTVGQHPTFPRPDQLGLGHVRPRGIDVSGVDVVDELDDDVRGRYLLARLVDVG